MNLNSIQNMKKLLLFAITLFAYNVQAQTDRLLGVHFGAPVGDAADISTFNFGVDAAFLFYVTDELYVGAAGGFTHFVGKEIDNEFSSVKLDGFNYIYFAGSAQYSFGKLFAAADVGFAFYSGDSDLGKSGVYYQPKLGYHIIDALDVYVSYKGLPGDGYNIATLGGGISYRY